jgi:hypothetical protein
VIIVRDIKPSVDGGASTAPNHVEAFPNDVSELSAAADAITGKLGLADIILAADSVSVHVSHFKGVHSSAMYIRSLGYGATLDAEDARGMASDQSTSAIPECPVNSTESRRTWLRSQRSLGHSATLGGEATRGLASEHKPHFSIQAGRPRS